MNLSELYDKLYDKVDAFMVKTNPCKVENGKCIRGRNGGRNFCCDVYGEMPKCKHLSKDGCKANKPLACRLWLCGDARENLTPDEDLELYHLEQDFSDLFIMAGSPDYVRKSKEEFFKK